MSATAAEITGTNPDPRAFAGPARDRANHIRVGCADDRLVAGVYPPNPATFDKAQWEAAMKIPAIKALVETGKLLPSPVSGGKVSVENRDQSPIDIRLPEQAKA